MNGDLIVLVADIQQESVVNTLLRTRFNSLSIRPVIFEVLRHPQKDSGVFHTGHSILELYRPPLYDHAVVILDREWGGAPGDADYQRKAILEQLLASGWQADNCEVIVCDPELEAWVWSTSNHVPTILRTTWEEIHSLANSRSYWAAETPKPQRPKELLECILLRQSRPRTSAILEELAAKVSLKTCNDPAFNHLKEKLASWFGV
jgi:hypothetical protein